MAKLRRSKMSLKKLGKDLENMRKTIGQVFKKSLNENFQVELLSFSLDGDGGIDVTFMAYGSEEVMVKFHISNKTSIEVEFANRPEIEKEEKLKSVLATIYT